MRWYHSTSLSSRSLYAIPLCVFSFENLIFFYPRTYKEGGRGWMPLPHKVFLSFFLRDKTLAPEISSSCSFIPRADFETCLVMVSCYGYEI